LTSYQFDALLRDLAHVAGLPETSALLTSGAFDIAGRRAVLVHKPDYDPDLLQMRLVLGSFPPELKPDITQALLELNYVAGFAGEWVYSLLPGSAQAVLTSRIHLHDTSSAHDLWQVLSDCARHGLELWESLLSDVGALEVQA
jgi:hypothetical protein